MEQEGWRLLWGSGWESEDIVSGHLQGRHGLDDVLVQAVVLHRVPGAQTLFPTSALSQEEDLRRSKKRRFSFTNVSKPGLVIL